MEGRQRDVGIGVLGIELDGSLQRLLDLAAQALRQSEERFRLLVDGVSDYAIFMLNTQGTIISWNGTWSMSTSAQAVQLNAVWGSSANDFWAVGAGGSRQHFTGSTFRLPCR